MGMRLPHACMMLCMLFNFLMWLKNHNEPTGTFITLLLLVDCFKCDIHHRVFLLPLLPAGVRLTVDTVFKLLKETKKEWNWLADVIMWISPSKHDELAQHCSTADDCLMESIKFWMKRSPHASYRWIADRFNFYYLGAISQDLLEPIQGKNKWVVRLTLALVALTISLN